MIDIMAHFCVIAVVWFGLLVGCGNSGTSEDASLDEEPGSDLAMEDSLPDSEPDGVQEQDAQIDPGTDLGIDSGTDLGADPGTDLGFESGTDPGNDSGNDLSGDPVCVPNCLNKQCGSDGCGGTCLPGCATHESCTPDGTCSADYIWSWCPASSDYVGDPNWKISLVVKNQGKHSTGLYCSLHDIGRLGDDPNCLGMDGLNAERKMKARIRFVPGSYKLPEANGSFDFRLPICFETADPNVHPELSGVGTITTQHISNYYSFTISQPVSFQGSDWTFLLGINIAKPANPLVIDNLLNGDDVTFSYQFLLSPNQGELIDSYQFDSCHFDPSSQYNNRHTITFSKDKQNAGTINLHLRLAECGGICPPDAGIHWKADGNFKGVSFDQQDYYKLIYSAIHHHFTRHHVVIFHNPIQQTCGLKITCLDGDSASLVKVAAIDCDWNEIESYAVDSVTFVTNE